MGVEENCPLLNPQIPMQGISLHVPFKPYDTIWYGGVTKKKKSMSFSATIMSESACMCVMERIT